jgi:PKHD-type hydroxylase
MVHENQFWIYDKVIPEHICDEIKKIGLSKELEKGLTANKTPEEHKEDGLSELLKYRDSDLNWLDENWIYKEIAPVVKQANKDAKWNYDWDRMEQAQFTKYAKGQYYKWHMDSKNKPFDDPEDQFLLNKVRKLSLSLLLSHPDEYKGGDFEFDFSNVESGTIRHPLKELSAKGSMVVFPSHTYHRVTPVTEGTRYSLVIWCIGDPFK